MVMQHLIHFVDTVTRCDQIRPAVAQSDIGNLLQCLHKCAFNGRRNVGVYGMKEGGNERNIRCWVAILRRAGQDMNHLRKTKT